jgi:1-acyl-sn-glycerol-3-phosphate acyltransferase
MKRRPATAGLFNCLGRQAAYFYVRRLMRSDVEWETDPPLGAKIIAANHPTTTDPFLMMSWPFEPVYILISEAAFKVPLIGRLLRLAGHIPVYAHRGQEAFETALHLLGEGRTVGIFPEGALSEEDGRLVTARSGAVRLAVTARVPIVPAGIAPDWHFVTARQLQRFGVTERMRWFWLGAYEVTVGKPLVIDHAADDREAVKQSTNILKREIERLMERSARRLLDASWPLTTRVRETIGDTDAPRSPTAHIMTGSVAVMPEKGSIECPNLWPSTPTSSQDKTLPAPSARHPSQGWERPPASC